MFFSKQTTFLFPGNMAAKLLSKTAYSEKFFSKFIRI